MKSLMSSIRHRTLSNAVSSICERLEARQLFAVTSGTFADEVPYGTETESALCVATGDVNNDGKVDIIAGTSGTDTDNVRVYLGNGDGTFAAGVKYASDGQAAKLRVADFNGDGVNDVMLLNRTYNTSANTNIRVYLSNASGVLAAPISVGAERYDDAEIGDLNSDGRPDIVAIDSFAKSFDVLTNKGDGTFNDPASVSTTEEGSAVTVGDLNNDGNLDVVLGNRHDSQAMSFLGNGNATFGGEHLTQFPNGQLDIKLKPHLLYLKDTNADGKQDLLSVDTENGTLVHAFGNGDGSFNTSITYSFPSADSEMAFADFDGDGHIDAAAGSGTGGSVKVNSGKADGTFDDDRKNFFVTSVPLGVAAGDFNNDGKMDLVSAQSGTFSNLDSRNIAVWMNSSAGNTPEPTDPEPTDPEPTDPEPTTPAVVDLTTAVTGDLPTAVVGGDDGKVTVIVTNNGDDKYAGPVTIELFASTDGAVDGGDTLLTTLGKNVSLKADKSKSFKLGFDFAAGLPDGAYTILARVSNVTGETETTNNTASAAAPVTIAAPFVQFATNITTELPTAVVGGDKGNVKVKVQNNGNVKFSDTATIELFASTDGIVDGSDVAIATFTKKLNLNVGKSTTPKFNFNYPIAIEDGGYQLLAKVTGTLVQDNGTNTAASSTAVTIAEPFVNLESTLTTKPETKLGKKTTASLLLENLGNVAAKGDVTITVFASTDGQLAGATQLLTTDKSINIKSGKGKKISLSLDTREFTNGLYTLIATVTWNGAPANTNVSDPATVVIEIV